MTRANLARKLRQTIPVLTSCLLLLGSAPAQTFSVIYNIHRAEPNDENLIYAYPEILAQGRDGNIYGTAIGGGAHGDGGAYRVTPSGSFTTLFSFSGGDGSAPFSGLTLGTDGNFYGGTAYGGIGAGTGQGTLFKLSPSGTLTVLYEFTDGSDGAEGTGLVEFTDGNFYGITATGAYGGGGAFKLTPAGQLTMISHETYALAAPVLGTDGNFYGTDGRSKVFKMTPGGKITVLYSLCPINPVCSYGLYPIGPLVEGTDGTFYGTAQSGGPKGGGSVFQITTEGAFTLLHAFDSSQGSTDGYAPSAGLVLATDGSFYGVTAGGGLYQSGTIFKITSSGEYSQLFSFASSGTGIFPLTTLLQHTNGKLYGHTPQSGTFGEGTIFSFDVGLAPFVGLLPASGKVGKTIGILGQGFTGTTAVAFNGTAATFHVVSDTSLTATVPNLATTGSVTVTTPSGMLTSNRQFVVTP